MRSPPSLPPPARSSLQPCGGHGAVTLAKGTLRGLIREAGLTAWPFTLRARGEGIRFRTEAIQDLSSAIARSISSRWSK